MATSAAAGLLGRQLKQMQTDKDIPGISCGLVGSNIFEWEVMLMISDECKFYGGMLCSVWFEDYGEAGVWGRGVRKGSWRSREKGVKEGMMLMRGVYRWFLPRASNISAGVSSSTTEDGVSDPYFSS